jgi:methionine synthase II (cobalamin-independent)
VTLHADHIGSLLRPPELLQARDAGNLITWDDQRRELDLVVGVADEVWGS